MQTLYSAWGSKRALLRAAMETLITDTDEGFEPGRQPLALIRGLPAEDAGDVRALLAYLSHHFRLVSQRSAVAWQIYRDATAVDPDIAADWQQLQDIRRRDMRDMLAILPSNLFPGGLSAAADTLWAIASPQTHELLVRYADYTYDQYETWLRETLLAALTNSPDGDWRPTGQGSPGRDQAGSV